MNATYTKRKIKTTETRIAELEPEIEALEERRRGLLRELSATPQTFREKQIAAFLDEVDTALDTARLELRRSRDQLVILRESLPSPEAIAQAEARAEALTEQAADLRDDFAASWESVLGHLTEAAEEAKRVAGARGAYRELVSAAHREADEFALRVPLPDALTGHTDPGLRDERSEPLALALLALVEDALRGAWEVSHLRAQAVEDERRRLALGDARAAAA